ncbi:hypothetical protein GSI_05024 [Ganoderma sinense ZZ0214-1]|uniref:Uncharacterized protein n=1 Tax=Ganoderma sinense ZZ0214-1 TaxID=1077348 RepID=A0A2G8SGL4_9APHY|nr:hypothetical protein GSI_05024 [Ganoderma sinense ZZ0214-1]
MNKCSRDSRRFASSNLLIIYDIEADTETILPEIPNGTRVSNPRDGSAILLPFSLPDFIPEVFAGTAQGWVVEHMLEPRVMPERVHLSNGQILIASGAGTGFAATCQVGDLIGDLDADHAVRTPSLYTPAAPLGRRFSNVGLPTLDVAPVYHLTPITLLPQGNFLVADSNPNSNFTADPSLKFPSELRVETLDPSLMFVDRPRILATPAKIHSTPGSPVTVPISLPPALSLPGARVQASLMDLGFSSHAFHSSARLVFMDATISADRRSLTFLTPPNGRVYLPGPATIVLTIDDVTSEGVWVIMGSGNSPPTLE